MPTKRNVLPVAGVLSGALVWGLIWYPYRVLQDAGLSGAQSTMLTYALALLCGAFVLPRIWRERATLGGWVWLLVLSAGWTNLGYVLGMLQGEVMRVLLLFYLAPVWTVLFSRILLGEKLNRYGYAIVALSLCGAFIMLWRPGLGPPLPHNRAEWLGLSAGMSFALSNVVSRRAGHISVEVKSFSLWLGAILMTLPLVWWQGGAAQQLGALGLYDWLLLVLIGAVLCATSFAMQYGLTHLPANRAIVLLLFELVFAAMASSLLTSEILELRDCLGATLIVVASLLSGRLCRDNVPTRNLQH